MAKTTKAVPRLKKIEGTFADAWQPDGEGEVLVGTYVGCQEAKGARGMFKAYHIIDEDNKRWSISGAALNTIMPQVPKGTTVHVTYTGTVEMPRGPMREYTVECSEDVPLLDAMEHD